MTRLYSFFLCFSVLILSACGGGGAYYAPRWDAPPPVIRQAEKPPSSLSGPESETAQAARDAPAPAPAMTVAPGTDLPTTRVALLLPLSGQNRHLGESMLKAAQMALFDIGHLRFELMPVDSQGTPAGAEKAARQAATQGAQLVLGPIFSEEARAAKPVLAGADINMITFSTDWSLAGGNTYVMGFMPFDQVERITEYAVRRSLIRIGILAPGSDYGRSVSAAAKAFIQRYGAQTVAAETFSPNNPDLVSVVKRFSGYETMQVTPDAPAPYDAVMIPAGGETAITIANLMSNFGLPPSKVVRLGTGLFDDPDLLREDGLQGALFAAPSPRLRQGFESRYQSVYGQRPPRLASLAYDATALATVLAQRGLQSQGSPAFDRTAIGNPNGFSGIDGIFRFRADGLAERGLAVLQISKTGLKVIEDAPRTFERAGSF